MFHHNKAYKHRYQSIVMKKAFVLAFLALLVLSVGMVSARVIVTGKIFVGEIKLGNEVEGATVVVNCTQGGIITTKTILNQECGGIITNTSCSDGSYAIQFKETECLPGDFINVYAYKEGIGEGTGKGNGNADFNIKLEDLGVDLDVEFSDVALVPEFTTIIGIATLLGAVGIFFVIRKK